MDLNFTSGGVENEEEKTVVSASASLPGRVTRFCDQILYKFYQKSLNLVTHLPALTPDQLEYPFEMNQRVVPPEVIVGSGGVVVTNFIDGPADCVPKAFPDYDQGRVKTSRCYEFHRWSRGLRAKSVSRFRSR